MQNLKIFIFYLKIRGTWDSQVHLEQATDILIDTINCVGRNHGSWTQQQKTKGGISGYNAGCGNVQTYEGKILTISKVIY